MSETSEPGFMIEVPLNSLAILALSTLTRARALQDLAVEGSDLGVGEAGPIASLRARSATLARLGAGYLRLVLERYERLLGLSEEAEEAEEEEIPDLPNICL